jgi:hypothetical protein
MLGMGKGRRPPEPRGKAGVKGLKQVYGREDNRPRNFIQLQVSLLACGGEGQRFIAFLRMANWQTSNIFNLPEDNQLRVEWSPVANFL